MSTKNTNIIDEINKSDKKDKKTPNALIIIIKTRIPNYYKLNYKPYMSVPKSKSHVVYFDPLVKYYSSPIMNIPGSSSSSSSSSYKQDIVCSQFFESSQFDTMINRILSDFRYMQKPLTLKESTNSGVIENNINITLNALFKPNNLFYVNTHPYTIINTRWNTSEWKIDTKPIEDLMSTYEFSNDNVLNDAKHELDDIPEYLRQGNADNVNSVGLNSVGLGLKVAEPINKQIEPVPFISDKKTLDKMPRSFQKLYGKYLQKNTPVNFSDYPDLATDPFTLSLLIDVNELSTYLNDHPNENIIKLYNGYIALKTQLKTNDELFVNVCAEIGILNNTLNILFDDSYNAITTIKNQQSNNIQTINNIIKKITIQKQQYISALFNLTETLISMYTLQHDYFVCLQLFLIEIKKEFEVIGTSNNAKNIIRYFTKPLLDLKCIDSDIATLSYLITLDPNNTNSKSYFSNKRNIEQFFNTVLKPNKQQFLNEDINYLDERTKYLTNPSILLIEKCQYAVYFIKIILYNSYNEQNIWTILYKSVFEFSHQIGLYGNELLKQTQSLTNTYNAKYTDTEQKKLLDGVSGMRARFNSLNKQYNWFLVGDDGNQLPITDINKVQEQEYINNHSSQIQSYDVVMLYTYLLEIQCLRHNKLFVAEQNTNEFNNQYTILMEDYYKQIKKSIETLQGDAYIPSSILWDTNNYADINTINKNIDIIKKTHIVYKHRIQLNKEEIINLNVECDTIYDTLFETMSTSGFISQCNKIIALNLNPIPEYKTRSTYWLNLQIANLNIKKTTDLLSSFNTIIDNATKYDHIDVSVTTTTGKPQDFIVYGNTANGDCLFESVRDALNGQLDSLDANTDNVYTELVDNKKRFTVKSLRKLVSDNYTEEMYKTHCSSLGGVINNAGVCAFDIDNPELDHIREFRDLFVNHMVNPPAIRTFDEVKEYMSHPCGNGYNYWGDETTINILQQILKIKFIIFDMTPRMPVKKIQIGDFVKQRKTNSTNSIIYRVSKISNNNYGLIDTTNGNSITDIDTKDIKIISDNIYSHFRVNCSIPLQDTENMDDYIFLLQSHLENGVSHYEFVRDASNNNYIYTFDEIPQYITYFIYDCCYRFLNVESRPNTGFGNIPKFQLAFNHFDETITNRYVKLDDEPVINDEPFLNVNQEHIEQLNKEIDNVKHKNDIISDQYNNIQNEYPNENYPENVTSFLKQLTDAKNENLHNISNLNQEILNVRKTIIDNVIGGAVPLYNYKSKQYPGYTPHYPIRPYATQQLQKYKSNKQSKLAYYVSIELELFPGTSANALQKTQVHCQSNFERIRESWSDLWGYQYRPGAMTEAYKYNTEMNIKKENEKGERKEDKISKKTQKQGGKKCKNKTYKIDCKNKH
jgi:hypothetical protein